jgi:hypothetical protein
MHPYNRDPLLSRFSVGEAAGFKKGCPTKNSLCDNAALVFLCQSLLRKLEASKKASPVYTDNGLALHRVVVVLGTFKP